MLSASFVTSALKRFSTLANLKLSDRGLLSVLAMLDDGNAASDLTLNFKFLYSYPASYFQVMCSRKFLINCSG